VARADRRSAQRARPHAGIAERSSVESVEDTDVLPAAAAAHEVDVRAASPSSSARLRALRRSAPAAPASATCCATTARPAARRPSSDARERTRENPKDARRGATSPPPVTDGKPTSRSSPLERYTQLNQGHRRAPRARRPLHRPREPAPAEAQRPGWRAARSTAARRSRIRSSSATAHPSAPPGHAGRPGQSNAVVQRRSRSAGATGEALRPTAARDRAAERPERPDRARPGRAQRRQTRRRHRGVQEFLKLARTTRARARAPADQAARAGCGRNPHRDSG
jgi:hypothetical protein